MSNWFHGFLDDQLTSDEHVLYRAHLSWIPVAVHMVPIMMIAGAVSGIVWGITNNIWTGILSVLICLLIGLLSQVGYIYKILATDIVVTNRRFTYKIGIVRIRDNRESSLSRIDDTDIDMGSIPERIFKYGDITVETLAGGKNEPFYSFKHVARPRLLKKAINEAKDQYAAWGEVPMAARNMPPVPTRPPTQTYEQVEPEPLFERKPRQTTSPRRKK